MYQPQPNKLFASATQQIVGPNDLERPEARASGAMAVSSRPHETGVATTPPAVMSGPIGEPPQERRSLELTHPMTPRAEGSVARPAGGQISQLQPIQPPQPAPTRLPVDQVSELQERRNRNQREDRKIGRVTYCSGARATISTTATNLSGATTDFWAVGRLISIHGGTNRIVALVCEMRTDSAAWDEESANSVSVQVELVGEVSKDKNGGESFKRGLSRYPQVGAVAFKMRVEDLEIMHDLGEKMSVEVGRLSQNEDVPATISVNDMLRKHFAVVGTTGVGKSCSLTLLVRQCLAVKPELRVLLLDPHNEFATAFGPEASLLDADTLKLPYWLFKLDEIEDVVFRSKVIDEEADILRELISLAKAQFHAEKTGETAVGTFRKSLDPNGFNADTPAPYRLLDLFKLIDEMLGQLEPRYNRLNLKTLRVRLDSLISDQRYGFMFPKGAVTDDFSAILATIFRLPALGKPISIVNLSGLPSDVTNAVVSVLARLSFDVSFASQGTIHVLLVCEEAHRYVPQEEKAGFLPARRAIARIAKEGRKYGCSIAVVSQRPGELDPTILSQCSTVFAMRLSNDRDQAIIRSAISDSSSSTISFLSALDNREAIVFGEGVATPMRFKFTFQEVARLPSAPGAKMSATQQVESPKSAPTDVSVLVARLRGTRTAPINDESSLEAPLPSARVGRLAPLGTAGAVPGPVPQKTTVAGTPLRLNQSQPSRLTSGGW